MIHPERIRPLNDQKAGAGDYVLYWMQAAQRAEDNHALEFAAGKANELRLPLVVFFGLTARYPGANGRHYTFMLEGLKETAETLARRGVRMVIRRGEPDAGVVEMGRRASLVVVDDGYLHIQRKWRASAAAGLDRPLIQVDTNVIVPIPAASPKEEYSAATLRPKIHRRLSEFLVPLRRVPLRRDSLGLAFVSENIGDIGCLLASLRINMGVGPAPGFRGGASPAMESLKRFVRTKLSSYAEDRNDPSLDGTSGLSPHLHFGQISPLTVALAVGRGTRYGRAAFLEELIVRRELAMNFAHYNRAYDRFAGLPEWARETLLGHAADRREYAYEFSDFERARTHDPYWNAAQTEMVLTGRMHGYMRMYWGKKILEWSRSPAEAFRTAAALNDKYELDGRDPNGYAGVAWCFGKHDRPWARRQVFGMVRAMTAGGLRRKFDADAYVRKVERLSSS